MLLLSWKGSQRQMSCKRKVCGTDGCQELHSRVSVTAGVRQGRCWNKSTNESSNVGTET